ncbi:4041_t:CDS:2, partial [Ambispora leptoticha]
FKNKKENTTLEPVSYSYIKELANIIQFPEFVYVELEDAMADLVSLLEADLPVVAPFFDSNLGVPKSTYYKEIAESLNIIIMQNSSSIQPEFCYSSIKDTLDLESYLEKYNTQLTLLKIENSNIQKQIILLRKDPHLSSDVLPNEQAIQTIEEKINTFNILMST